MSGHRDVFLFSHREHRDHREFIFISEVETKYEY